MSWRSPSLDHSPAFSGHSDELRQDFFKPPGQLGLSDSRIFQELIEAAYGSRMPDQIAKKRKRVRPTGSSIQEDLGRNRQVILHGVAYAPNAEHRHSELGANLDDPCRFQV